MGLQLRPNEDALFLDIDGTLLDIAPRPDEVVVPDELLNHLLLLQKRLGGALALVSGRGLDTIDHLFSPLQLHAAGAHGAQLRIGAETELGNRLPHAFIQRVNAACAIYPAVIVENKQYSLAVHCRQAPELEGMLAVLLQQMVSETAPMLSIMHGKKVFDIVNPAYNKGAAIGYFMAHPPFAGRRPVFFGDDETDLSAIEACKGLGGVGMRVAAGEIFTAPADVRQWIEGQAQ